MTARLNWTEPSPENKAFTASFFDVSYAVCLEPDDAGEWWQAYANEEAIGHFETVAKAKACCERDALNFANPAHSPLI